MSITFDVNAEARKDVGKGASRRLRRQGKVPAILYGGSEPAVGLVLEQNDINKQLQNEAFYSHVLNINVGGKVEQAILRDLQRHPYKPLISHVDFQRVSASEKIKVHVPLHFINEETSKGVKQQGGIISHLMIDVEVACLPAQLPEFIEVDVANLEMGQSIHLSELTLPSGVELVALGHGAEHDTAVVSIHHARGGGGGEEVEGEEGETA